MLKFLRNFQNFKIVKMSREKLKRFSLHNTKSHISCDSPKDWNGEIAVKGKSWLMENWEILIRADKWLLK